MLEALATPWGELALYHRYALEMISGKLPYLDFFPEYPPLAMLFFKIPLMFGTRYYMLSYYALVAVFLILTAILIKKMSGNPFIFLAAVLPLGGLFWDRFDIFPAFFSILAIAYISNKKTFLAFLTLSIGVFIKIYPIVFLPILVLRTLVDFGFRKTVIALLFAFILPIAISVWNIVDYGGKAGLERFVKFQSQRGLQIESVRATKPLIQHLKGEIELEAVYKHNTFELIEK